MSYQVLTMLSLISIGLSGALILTGLVLIKLGHREWHKRAMLSASALAILFLVFYGLKYFLYPPKPYDGAMKGLYLFILISHSIMAVINMPLAGITLFFGLKGRYEKHKRIAPITAGVWIYVALTGWLIYLFLSFM